MATELTPEQLAELFHETYERLAPLHGYKTREDSAVAWIEVPSQNRRIMVSVAAEVLAVLGAEEDYASSLRADLDRAQERLALAERVCAAYAGTPAAETSVRAKATLQAWMDWSAKHGKLVPFLTDAEYEEMAARRDEIREATLAKIREPDHG